MPTKPDVSIYRITELSTSSYSGGIAHEHVLFPHRGDSHWGHKNMHHLDSLMPETGGLPLVVDG